MTEKPVIGLRDVYDNKSITSLLRAAVIVIRDDCSDVLSEITRGYPERIPIQFQNIADFASEVSVTLKSLHSLIRELGEQGKI